MTKEKKPKCTDERDVMTKEKKPKCTDERDVMPKEKKPKITDERDALIEKLRDKSNAIRHLNIAADRSDDRLFQTAIMDVAEAWLVEENAIAGRYVRKKIGIKFDPVIDAAEREMVEMRRQHRDLNLEIQKNATEELIRDSGTITGRYHVPPPDIQEIPKK